jgi:hypothetical protein
MVLLVGAKGGTRTSKIRCEPVDFPVAVAGRIGTVAAADFFRLIRGLAVTLGTAGRGLGEGALGGGGQRRLFARLIGLRFACGALRPLVWVSWHRLRLGVAVPKPQVSRPQGAIFP